MSMLKRNANSPKAIGTARAIVSDPQVRAAASKAASPLAQLSIAVGRRAARRRTGRRVRQLGDAMLTARAMIETYGPQALAQLQESGIVARPKRSRKAPRFIVGALAGAGAMYLLEPGHGREHRQQLQKLVSH